MNAHLCSPLAVNHDQTDLNPCGQKSTQHSNRNKHSNFFFYFIWFNFIIFYHPIKRSNTKKTQRLTQTQTQTQESDRTESDGRDACGQADGGRPTDDGNASGGASRHLRGRGFCVAPPPTPRPLYRTVMHWANLSVSPLSLTPFSDHVTTLNHVITF